MDTSLNDDRFLYEMTKENNKATETNWRKWRHDTQGEL